MNLSLRYQALRFLRMIIIVGMMNLQSSCGKKNKGNHAQAQNYYKLCMIELAEEHSSNAALRKALNYCEQALQCQEKAEYRGTYATILFRLKLYEKSLQEFKKALRGTQCSRVRGELLNNMACLYAQSRENQKAEKIWKNLVKRPDYLTPEVALINLAKISLSDASYEQAKAYCIKAITLAPTYLDAHFYLAVLAYKTGDLSLAKKEVLTTLFMEPEHPGALQLRQILI